MLACLFLSEHEGGLSEAPGPYYIIPSEIPAPSMMNLAALRSPLLLVHTNSTFKGDIDVIPQKFRSESPVNLTVKWNFTYDLSIF